jgi:hypothetical protein
MLEQLVAAALQPGTSIHQYPLIGDAALRFTPFLEVSRWPRQMFCIDRMFVIMLAWRRLDPMNRFHLALTTIRERWNNAGNIAHG